LVAGQNDAVDRHVIATIHKDTDNAPHG
jgi:hypothetical protein